MSLNITLDWSNVQQSMLQLLRLVPVRAGWSSMHREACLDVDGETRRNGDVCTGRSFSCSSRERDQGYLCAYRRHA